MSYIYMQYKDIQALQYWYHIWQSSISRVFFFQKGTNIKKGSQDIL